MIWARCAIPAVITVIICGTAAAGFTPAPEPPDQPPTQDQPQPPGQPPTPDRYLLGRVLEILEVREQDVIVENQFIQVVRVRLRGVPVDSAEVRAEFSDASADPARRLRPGDGVVVAAADEEGSTSYYVIDRYRMPALGLAVGLFFILAVVFSRGRGVTAILGLGITALVLARFIVPAIVGGGNPLVVSIVGALVIAFSSIYLAHGFNLRTSIAVGSTLVTLVIAWALAIAFVGLANLFGLGSEEAFYLQLAPVEQLNLRGLLLGGIILGALGVLDDITTAQAAAVDELRKANPALTMQELYRRGLSVGTEHITSLVNTLFLAYAGASLPLFILFTIYNETPVWVALNSEFVAEEIVRTLVGSVALILAVPITTVAAAVILSRRGHRHSHL
ncbi:MAG: YibE/F family protein [bacterium]